MSDMFNQEEKIHVELFSNDKVFLITKPKFGHSWCRTKFEPINSQLSDFNTSFNIEFVDLKLEESVDSLNSISKEYYLTITALWKNILNKREPRDIVIVYRNPIEAWISGFYQDTFGRSSFQDIANTPFFYNFVKNLNEISDISKDEFLSDCNDYISFFDIFNNANHYPILFEILNVYLDNYIQTSSFNDGHNTPYLPFIYKLLNTNMIDTSKIKLLDMYDAPFEVQLKNYMNYQDIDPADINHKRDTLQLNIMKRIIEDSKYKYFLSSYLGDKYNIYRDIKEKYKQYHIQYE